MKRASALILVIITINCVAQDVHFSQFNRSSLLLNPALVGFQNSDYKAVIQRRSQWESVSVPFNTFCFSVEKKDVFPTQSFGGQFLNDIAGDSHFKTTGVNLAYSKRVSFTSNNLFSLGVGFGFFQRSVIFDNLIFNDFESLPNINFTFFDLGFGAVNVYQITQNTVIQSGVAIYHINNPRQSLIDNKDVVLNEKINLHTSLHFELNNKVSIHPSALFSIQDRDKEFLLAINFDYLIQENQNTILKSGFAQRFNDAIIFYSGLKIKNISCLLSYDVNTSSLAAASDNKGGFEFSVTYNWNVSKNIKIKKEEKCPQYL